MEEIPASSTAGGDRRGEGAVWSTREALLRVGDRAASQLDHDPADPGEGEARPAGFPAGLPSGVIPHASFPGEKLVEEGDDPFPRSGGK